MLPPPAARESLSPSAAPADRPDGIDPSSILAALEVVCARPEFARSRRQQDLLRYVVHAEVRGEGETLKEYVIGVGALDKTDAFDPKLDSSVRSEASRIRVKLDALYRAEPHAHAIRIRLPKGSYRPVFDRAEESLEPEAVARPALATRRWLLGVTLGAAMALIALIVWIGPPLWSAAVSTRRFAGFHGDQIYPVVAPDGARVVFSRAIEGVPFLFVSGPDGVPITTGQQGEQAAWSPDGQKVVFRSRRDGGGLFVLDFRDSSVRKITAEGFHPAWSPDGRRIVYSSDRFTRPEERPTARSVLSILDLASAVATPMAIAPPVVDAIQPAWSPDGRWIAFWSVDTGGGRDVFVVDPQGGTPVRVTEPESLDWNPAWSPDGRLYWSSKRGGVTSVWRSRIGAGGRPQGRAEMVPLPTAYAGFLSFTRDGRLLYSNLQEMTSIYRTTIGADGRTAAAPVRVTPSMLHVRHPSLSPDGEWFVAFTSDPHEDLVVFRSDGSSWRRLTDDKFLDRGPAWSPDGRRIVFVSNRGGDYQLWSIQPDGRNLVQVTSRPQGAFAPVWSRDAQHVAWFERGFRAHISRMAPPATETALLGTTASGFVPTAWAADGESLLGEIPVVAGRDDNALASYSIPDGSIRPLGVRGHGPQWLVDGQTVLFARADTFYSLRLQTGEETPLLRLAGSLKPRFAFSPFDRSLYFEMRETNAELWLARVP